MEKDKERIWQICKNLFSFFGVLFLFFIAIVLAGFFKPFVIAGIIALLVEPIIKFNMNKLKMSRKLSSIIVIFFTILIIVLVTAWGVMSLADTLGDFSKNIPSIATTVSTEITSFVNKLAEENEEYFTEETISTFISSMSSVITNLVGYLQTAISKVLQVIISVPKIIVSVVITILALVFFTKDRIFIIDIVEHHVPEKWLLKMHAIKKEFFSTLWNYIRVYGKILIITTLELLVSFFILNLIGFKIEHIILLSIAIGIIDILPILGVGTVLIPWIIWSFITGDIPFAIALLIVHLIIFTIRQFIEPKLVSDQFGIHPIVTLLAMYTGFKIIGFTGLIIGPLVLMILRCVFKDQIKAGIFKSIFEVDK